MGDDIVLLLLSFGLTTVLGGGLGFYFQRQSWRQQHRAQQRDRAREQAMKAYEEVSALLDKRLYRMQRVFGEARRYAGGGVDASGLDAARDQYRDVVYTWNENLNRNLALVQTSFGVAARVELQERLYDEYSAIGRALEQFIRDVVAGGFDGEVPPINRRLNWLGRQVYDFNVELLELLQDGRVGADAPAAAAVEPSPTPLLQFGHAGEAVRRLQEALREAGVFEARIDGSFGRDTEDAVRRLQHDAGLEVDGVVGLATWTQLQARSARTVAR
jgi:hypothetical protein